MFYQKNLKCICQIYGLLTLNQQKDVVKDLDNKSYIDMTMSIGTNVLGYSNSFVNKAVINAIKKSTMSTLNAEEEVLLAKKLLKIHKWAGVLNLQELVEKRMLCP